MLNRKIVPLLYVALFLMHVELYSGKSHLYQALVIGIVGIQIEAHLFSSKVVLGGRKTYLCTLGKNKSSAFGFGCLEREVVSRKPGQQGLT